MDSATSILLIFSILLFASILAGKVSHKFGTPILLLFLLVGMIFGSDGIGIQFNSPHAVQVIGMISLSIILFSGGMDTKIEDIRPVAAPGITLATAGVLITALLTGAFIWWLFRTAGTELTITESLLLASVMASTDSASVFSILRQKGTGLRHNLQPTLELESGSNDPMAYILTVIMLQAAGEGGFSAVEAAGTFATQMVLGAVSGFLMGKTAVWMLNRLTTGTKALSSVLLLSFVFMTFSLTDILGGNGYLAVYIAGLVTGNSRLPNKYTLSAFFDGFTWLFQIVMFLSLGLLVKPHEMIGVILPGAAIALFMILVSRPVAVFACLAPFRRFTLRMKTYVSWVGLRGAVPIIFATYPLVAGAENSGLIFNTVFLITIVSLLLQGTTVSSMARRLGLSLEQHNPGFDIPIPDDLNVTTTEITVTDEFLHGCKNLRELCMPDDTLVIMIRRGDEYLVPRGDTLLLSGDILLTMSRQQAIEQRISGRKSLIGTLREGLLQRRRDDSSESTDSAQDPERQ